MASLEERISELEASFESAADDFALSDDLDTAWIAWCGVLVFFMQVGFAMLEVGSVSPKNTKAVLIKNMTDAALGAICWWAVGHGLAYGSDTWGFIGTNNFAFGGSEYEGPDQGLAYAQWFFQWAFAATSATIVSGAVAERVKIAGYVSLSLFITLCIYPVVVHWAWSPGGWASAYRCTDAASAEEYADCREDERPLLFGCGVADFAGSAVVHMTGGICALVAAAMVQPRNGRFRADGTIARLPQQSPALQTLGTLILWVGWYGFNGGSVGSVAHGRSPLVASAVVNSTISASASVLAVGILVKLLHKKFDSAHLNNGILSGLVAISASGPLISSSGAFTIGLLSSAFYLMGVNLLKRFRIDDVVQASAVHFGCGAWGLISSGLFTTSSSYREVYSYGDFEDEDRVQECCGLFYGCHGKLLGANVVFMLALVAWVAVLAYVCLLVIKYTMGLRVPLHVETVGMDRSRHPRGRSSIALKRALRSAARSEGKDGGTASHRPSFKPPHQMTPPSAPAAHMGQWRE